MIKNLISLTVLTGIVTVASSQTTPNQPSPTYPGNENNQPRTYTPTPSRGYNNASQSYPGQTTGGVLFSNRLGQTFSAQDLASQLQNLRNTIDQTLPMLSAFNESSSNMSNGGQQTVGGALSGIVSDVLHHNQSANQASTSSQNLTTSNLMSVLHGLLNKNSNTPAAATTPNAQDLITLQTDLQPVVSVLDRLNVSGISNQIASPYPNSGLTPTGR